MKNQRGQSQSREPPGYMGPYESRENLGPPGPREYHGPPGPRDYLGPPGPREYLGPEGRREYLGTPGPREYHGQPGPREYLGPPGPREYLGPPGPPVQQGSTTTVVIQQPQAVGNGKLVCNREGHRDWSSGLFSCGDDVSNCLLTWFCIECVLAEISQRTGESACVTCCVPGGLIAIRARLRTLGGIRGSICSDSFAIGCCYQCAVCQMKYGTLMCK